VNFRPVILALALALLPPLAPAQAEENGPYLGIGLCQGFIHTNGSGRMSDAWLSGLSLALGVGGGKAWAPRPELELAFMYGTNYSSSPPGRDKAGLSISPQLLALGGLWLDLPLPGTSDSLFSLGGLAGYDFFHGSHYLRLEDSSLRHDRMEASHRHDLVLGAGAGLSLPRAPDRVDISFRWLHGPRLPVWEREARQELFFLHLSYKTRF
jgi:hypothetical protein